MPARPPHQLERDADAAARRAVLRRSYPRPRAEEPPGLKPGTGTPNDRRPWTVWAFVATMVGLMALQSAAINFLLGPPLIGLVFIYFFVTGSRIVWFLAVLGGVLLLLATGPRMLIHGADDFSLAIMTTAIANVAGLVFLLHPATRRWFELEHRGGL